MSEYIEILKKFIDNVASDSDIEKYLVSNSETAFYLNKKLFEVTSDMEIVDFLDNPMCKCLVVRVMNDDGLSPEVYDLNLLYGRVQ
jgi:hypothetical protein